MINDSSMRRNRIIGKILIYTLLIVMAVYMVLPFYWSLVSSIRPEIESVSGFSLIPKTLTFEHYRLFFTKMSDVGGRISVWQIMFNTFFIVVCIIVLQLLSCSLGAYALARLDLPGKKIILKIMYMSMMVPGIVSLIPLFLVVNTMGLSNGYLGVILPGAISIYGVLFLRSFFMQTPKEIAEAARIDGASEFSIFIKMYVPLIIPGIITLGLFVFNSNWNSFLWPSIILPSDKMVLAVAIREFQLKTDENGPMMAAAIITILPTIAIFLAGQRYFMDNLAFSGIK